MALILVRNHQSLLDGPIVALCLRKKGLTNAVFAVDPDYALHPFGSRVLSLYGRLTGGHTMLPLNASKPLALRKCIKMLNDGRHVVIFPQGTGLKEPHRPESLGAQWLIQRTGARIITMSLNHDSWLPKPYFLTSVAYQ